jgi:hypothetical protein
MVSLLVRLEKQDFTLLEVGGIFACHVIQRAVLVVLS